ncbi:MAG: hypothetical protein JSS81_25245 [Acidobacteria bacterium]|nr:hypothetical protein [Acidobacteriota bacterium]
MKKTVIFLLVLLIGGLAASGYFAGHRRAVAVEAVVEAHHAAAAEALGHLGDPVTFEGVAAARELLAARRDPLRAQVDGLRQNGAFDRETAETVKNGFAADLGRVSDFYNRFLDLMWKDLKELRDLKTELKDAPAGGSKTRQLRDRIVAKTDELGRKVDLQRQLDHFVEDARLVFDNEF